MPSAWDKFLLLSWKNWIIQIRHPIQTIFEILVPVLICALLILIRGLVDINEVTEEFRYISLSTSIIGDVRFVPGVINQLAYSPKNPVLDDLVNKVSEKLEFLLPVEARENAMDLGNFASTRNPFASIEFEDSLSGIQELPAIINYALRFPSELRTNDSFLESLGGFSENWATNFRLSSGFTIGPRNRFAQDGGRPPGYILVS